MQRLRFDPVATSQSEAFKSLIASLIPFFIILTIFEIFFIYPALLLLLIYSYLEYQFWWFLLKKKGLVFLLRSIPTSIALYFIINLGVFIGLIINFFPISNTKRVHIIKKSSFKSKHK